jgi:hypothetical protein
MTKTKALLVFGVHGDKRPNAAGACSGSTEANSEFFRGAVLPFLEENVEKGGKKALVIYEALWPAVSHPTSTVEDYLKRLAEPLNRGKAIGHADMFAFGFEDKILEINRKAPYQVLCRVERQYQEVRAGAYELNNLSEEMRNRRFDESSLGIMVEYLTKLCAICMARDNGVFDIAEEFRKKNPGSVIIIPRGTAHRGLATWFEHGRFLLWRKYEVNALVDQDNADSDPFLVEALDRQYRGEASHEQIKRLAWLKLLFERYLDTAEYENKDMRAAARSNALSEYSKRFE